MYYFMIIPGRENWPNLAFIEEADEPMLAESADQYPDWIIFAANLDCDI